MSKQETWALEDHLCKGCGGRILRRVGGPSIMTAGGNPVYKCADCDASASAMGPDALCWCGFGHRRNNAGAYTCKPFSILASNPELESAFKACGCDPKRGEVGIVLTADLKEGR